MANDIDLFIKFGLKAFLMKSKLWIILFILCGTACNTATKEDGKSEPEQETQAKAEQYEKEKIILFFGNSITAGYGIATDQAFPALVQEKIDSLDLTYKVVNAGLSGETSSGGLSRIEWVLRTVPDIFVLELGANDGLRGLMLSETKKNLSAIIEKVKAVNPEVQIVIAGMEVPPNLGQDYTAEFRSIFRVLSKEHNALLIPFLLEGVAGEPELNQSDGIHPTEEGHAMVAEIVWDYLQPLMDTGSGDGV